MDLKKSYNMFLDSTYNKFELPIYVYILKCLMGGWFAGLGAHAAGLLASSYYNPEAGLSSCGNCKLAFGIIFSGALLLIVYTGTDLFTSNTASFTGLVLSKRISFPKYIGYLGISLLGNYLGAVISCFILTYLSGNFYFKSENNSAAARWLSELVIYKVSHGFLECIVSAIGCNIYVCLSVWIGYVMGFSGNAVLTQILLITTFAVAGFEHIVANSYIVNSGLMNNSGITLYGAYIRNLLPTLIGNFIAGAGIIGLSLYVFYGTKMHCDSHDIEDKFGD